MLAVDLDGTLLNSAKQISAEDFQALQEAFRQGIEIVPVTGRNYSFALPAVTAIPFHRSLITTNGALIRSSVGETYLRCLLPVESARQILDSTAEFREHTIVVYDQQGAGHLRIQSSATLDPALATARRGVAHSTWLQKNQQFVEHYNSLTDALDGDPLEILFTGPMDVIRTIEERLETASNNGTPFRMLRTEYPERDFALLDTIRADCSKGAALAHWSHLRGIQADEIMAIGDNYNDLEMLQFAGFPIVMGNADDCLKAQGWPVTLDCDSSGVAHAIRKYVLS